MASYTRAGVRLALVITGLICAVVSGLAPHLLRLAFPVPASELAGGALRILSLGMGAFAVLAVCSTALTSVGRSGVGALLNAGAAILIATGCWLTVPSAAFGPEMLERTATATAAALVLTAAISAVLLYRNNGAFAPPASLARVALALGVAIAVGTRLPYLGKIAVVAESARRRRRLRRGPRPDARARRRRRRADQTSARPPRLTIALLVARAVAIARPRSRSGSTADGAARACRPLHEHDATRSHRARIDSSIRGRIS